MKQFSNHILNWYKITHRNLPWRGTKDPYLIWLSEVILQQTRVDQGIEYYLRFAKKYPSVHVLASAGESEVLKNWQGLGYYSRARNLLFAARQVMEEHSGVFPNNYASLKTLKGVGDYTAAAIASIAFGEVVPVVDGNVKRVISRLFGMTGTGKELYDNVRTKMSELIDTQRPGDFNQAVMEFGALQCISQNPSCEKCIFKDQCFAYDNDMVSDLPVKAQKKAPRIRYFSYLVIISKEGMILNKRSGNDIWKNMYEFPLIETAREVEPDNLIKEQDFISWLGESAGITESSKTYKHQLSHQTIYARFHMVVSDKVNILKLPGDWEFVSNNQMDKFPVPRLIDRYLEDQK